MGMFGDWWRGPKRPEGSIEIGIRHDYQIGLVAYESGMFLLTPGDAREMAEALLEAADMVEQHAESN